MTPENYTWSAFQSAVTDLLGIDGKRAGVTTFRSAWMRQGVIRLQNLFDCYRKGHETVYHPADLVYEGQASKGVKPPESAVRDVWLFQLAVDSTTKQPIPGGKGKRYAVDPRDWADRFGMINGKLAVNNGRGLYCADPHGYTFYLYPRVFDGWVVSLFWDGRKLDFQNDEETPFDEQAAGAVALFVKAQIAREVDKDLNLSASYMADFRGSLPGLHKREMEQKELQEV